MEYVHVQGERVPSLGFGTARMKGEECESAVENALELGYRHFDTAQMYENERAVGAVIRDADVDREDVFLTTKIHRRNLAYDDVVQSFSGSLRRLDMEYVDLLLIHAPSKTVPLDESLDAMNTLVDDSTVRHVGVSNFSIKQLQKAIELSDAPVFTNQVEYHPYRSQHDLLEFCIENDILLTAYSPLAEGDVEDDDTLADIGEQYGKTASQVALRWLIQQDNVAAIPKAASRKHQRENIDVFDFELTADEMERIFELEIGLADRMRSLLGL